MKKRLEILDSQRLKNQIPRGITLFLPIPPERTCGMAGIAEPFCVCHEIEEFDIESYIAHQVAIFFVYNLNMQISQFAHCAFLELKTIMKAYTYNTSEIQLTNSLETSTRPVLSAVKVIFMTAPGNAEFYGTVVRQISNNSYSWALSDITRVNTFGNQSHCISDKNMKKYCYCTDLLTIKM